MISDFDGMVTFESQEQQDDTWLGRVMFLYSRCSVPIADDTRARTSDALALNLEQVRKFGGWEGGQSAARPRSSVASSTLVFFKLTPD